jgi:hypothetical protein
VSKSRELALIIKDVVGRHEGRDRCSLPRAMPTPLCPEGLNTADRIWRGADEIRCIALRSKYFQHSGGPPRFEHAGAGSWGHHRSSTMLFDGDHSQLLAASVGGVVQPAALWLKFDMASEAVTDCPLPHLDRCVAAHQGNTAVVSTAGYQ